MSDRDRKLMSAVLAGSLQGALMALSEGADPDARTTLGIPALLVAAGSSGFQSVSMTAALLDAGADVCVEDANGKTALHMASGAGNDGVLRILVNAGASVCASDADGATPLSDAMDAGMWDVALALVRMGGARGSAGGRGLLSAARGGPGEVLDALLTSGARVGEQDASGLTAAHLACVFGSHGVLDALLSFGCDPDIGTGEVGPPLFCCFGNRVEAGAEEVSFGARMRCAGILAKNGADMRALDPSGRPPLAALLCSSLGFSPHWAGFLVERGADALQSGRDGSTLLHFAARAKASEEDCVEMARWSLSSGVDPRARNRFGRFAWQDAQDKGLFGLADFLRSQTEGAELFSSVCGSSTEGEAQSI